MKSLIVSIVFIVATSLYVPAALADDSDSESDSDSGGVNLLIPAGAGSQAPVSLPEPGTIGLMGMGLVGIAWLRRRK